MRFWVFISLGLHGALYFAGVQAQLPFFAASPLSRPHVVNLWRPSEIKPEHSPREHTPRHKINKKGKEYALEAKPKSMASSTGNQVGESPAPTYATIQELASWGNSPPPYPEFAIENGWEGDVLMELVFGEQGTVKQVKLVRTSGFELLDENAVQTAKDWVLPRKLRQKVRKLRVPVEFRLVP